MGNRFLNRDLRWRRSRSDDTAPPPIGRYTQTDDLLLQSDATLKPLLAASSRSTTTSSPLRAGSVPINENQGRRQHPTEKYPFTAITDTKFINLIHRYTQSLFWDHKVLPRMAMKHVSFLLAKLCTSPNCLYLHEFGSQEDNFTKDEIISEYTRF
ncbi:hypothetical protein L1887_32166 [Cichorium endivia]|nr:hypothetical protein L1887_32166 [Cichorium endivia]